ncbi:putative glutathione transferase [Helianthus anomalus]
MARDEVKLLGIWQSPFTFRVKLALSFKGVEYEYVEEDILNKSPMLLQYNPMYKKVPVLVHNGKPIVESLIIMEYIDEIWKDHPLLPEDPLEKARYRFWAKFVDDKVNQI